MSSEIAETCKFSLCKFSMDNIVSKNASFEMKKFTKKVQNIK